jgi:hypothetical protein
VSVTQVREKALDMGIVGHHLIITHTGQLR